ncbi:hypothetical protein NLG97_g1690 [Lecanicillium saksenae]|uniref:Uncharacterized protein n=1 Tax=Lecanicillium saksenae TaxID=468837 RepID=A0ACC1R4B1_9HYPO|nr:hypothetical protein NLG97_g1690 [Lecanicillium saksenae]
MPSTTRDVLLFSGQGSNNHLVNPQAASKLLDLLKEEEKEKFRGLLKLCRDAFRIELASATPDEQRLLGHDAFQVFDEPDSLLFPPRKFQSHPILETSSLYLHQILELILFQSHESNHHVVEVAGLCTGALPAVLAGCYTSFVSDDFIAAALQGFRLAFWIGLRAEEKSYSIEQAPDESEASCLLSIFGGGLEDVSQFIQLHPYGNNVQISAIFSDSNVSISGPCGSLHHIKASLADKAVQSRWAHVHAVYHGGEGMGSTLAATLADVKRRCIRFPGWDSLLVPLRSISTGRPMGPHTQNNSGSLLETILTSIFIDKMDWQSAGRQLCSFHREILDRDTAAEVRIIGIGPGSKALGPSSKDYFSHSRLKRVESWSEHLSRLAEDDIAIVGLSVNYPGAAGVDQFWDLLESGRSMVSKIPADRFTTHQTELGNEVKKAKFTPKHGNFLESPFDFDASYFNISPREAKSIDPQQRLLLHAALEALEDAGYRPNSTPTFQSETFGVYAGVATGDYVDNLRNEVDVYYSPGTLRAFLSGRISYAFKFKGPSIVIDTACSSSLVAVYEACKALRSRECTAAIALGVNTITSPDMYVGLGRAHFLSPTGQCKPFDERADGYCRAEGCGGVVLKKLSDAIAEGDHIHGVIRGIGVNQCGTAKSITHPDSETQASLMKSVLRAARASPDSISVIEAHGTGTQAGDHAECASLRSVFGLRAPTSPLYLGSVKGSFGHAEAASGIAGLAKLLIMMERKKIPPQSSHNVLNPQLKSLVQGSLRITRQLEDWHKAASQLPRRALLNNFGAAGSNAALILEEYIPSKANKIVPDDRQSQQLRSHQLLTLTAKTKPALEMLKSSCASYLQNKQNISLDDICYSINARRQEHSLHRFSAVASDRTGMIRQLTEPQRQRTDKVPHSEKTRKKLIFVFSGQGGAYAGMGADLLATSPHFASTVQKFDKVLCNHGFSAVAPYMTGSWTKTDTLTSEDDLVVMQCALFVLEYGLASLWMSWGLSPDLIVAHSIGEYAGFAIAKAIDPTAALLLVARRARLMAKQCETQSTGMLACRISSTAMMDILENAKDACAGISIACTNSSQDLVLAGPLTSLNAFSSHCKTGSIKHKRLQVPFGFHSNAMDPILEDLSTIVAEAPMDVPSISLGSSLYGRIFKATEKPVLNYFVDHARQPVNFAELTANIAQSFAEDELTIVEIGPSPSTDAMFRSALAGKPYSFVASLRHSQPAWTTLIYGLQDLFARNYSLNWREIYRGVPMAFQRSIPKYPLQKTSYFVPYRPPTRKSSPDTNEALTGKPPQPKYAFLSQLPPVETDDGMTVYNTGGHEISPFINAHCVGGVPLCPASVYLEVVLQAAAHQNTSDLDISTSVFENITFEHPLVLSKEQGSTAVSLQTKMSLADMDNGVHFTSSSGASLVHCIGDLRCERKRSQTTTDILRRKLLQLERLRQSLDTEPTALMQKFSSKTIYSIIFPRVVKYSDPFLTLQQLSLSSSGLDGSGIFRLTALESGGRYVTSPALLDTLLHAAGFIANAHVTSEIACICVDIEQAVICCDYFQLYDQDLRVYCTVGDLDHSFIADAYAVGPDGSMVAFAAGMRFKKIRLKSFESHLSRVVNLSGNKIIKAAIPTTHARTTGGAKPPQTANAAAKGVVEDMLLEHETRAALCILSQMCGLEQDIEMSQTLEQLGVDSLLMIELMDALQQELPHLAVDHRHLEGCKTVQELISLIANVSPSRTEIPRVPSLTHTRTTSPTAFAEGVDTPLEAENDHSEAFKSIFMDVCGLDPEKEGRDRELALLGVDSLMSIELIEELSDRLGIKMDMRDYDMSDLTYEQLELLCAPRGRTMSDLRDRSTMETTVLPSPYSMPAPPLSMTAGKVSGRENITETVLEKCVKLLQTGSRSKPSLFMFHDGSGLCSMYSKLHDIDQKLHAIYSLESPSSSPRNVAIETMEELAAWYIKHANLLQQPDEVILGGWSFGGVLAFEVSRQLLGLGKPVKGLILIDSPAPINHQALPEVLVSYVLARGESPTTSKMVQEARERVKGQFLKHAAMLQRYSPALAYGSGIPCVFIRCVQTMDTERLCNTSYPWLSDAQVNQMSITQWESLIGCDIQVLDVDCNHFEAFDTVTVDVMSRQLQKACSILN